GVGHRRRPRRARGRRRFRHRPRRRALHLWQARLPQRQLRRLGKTIMPKTVPEHANRQNWEQKRMKRLVCMAALLVVFGCSAGAAPLESPADTRALADAFMKLVVQDKISDAFELIRPQWPIPQSELNTLA